MPSLASKILEVARYSVVICRNRHNQYLCIQERTGQWWIPGGSVEKGETHLQAAIRETREEAGIDIQIKGIMSIDQMNFNNHALRIVFYG